MRRNRRILRSAIQSKEVKTIANLKKKELEILIKMENVIGMNEHYLFGEGDSMYENQARNCPESEFGVITHTDFVELMCLIERQLIANKEFADKSKKRMRAYRSTPEGLAKSRESSRKSARKYYRNKAAEESLKSKTKLS